MPGYHKPPHYMEVPYWIAQISGFMEGRWHQELHVVEDPAASVRYLQGKPGVLLYSTMEANKIEIYEMLKALKDRRVVMGGHVDPQFFGEFENLKYLQDLSELARSLTGINLAAPPSYELFRGQAVIPRLTLSTGCLYNCSFCMVPRQLSVLSPQELYAQVESFRPLHFNLIYLDDKTFSQAPNWTSVREINERVRNYNEDFLGFIAQTSPRMAALPGRMQDFKDLEIKYLELGIESLTPEVRRIYRKPYTEKDLDQVVSEAQRLGIQIIPDFVFGHPQEDYGSCVEWVHKHREIVPVVNVNFLSVLHASHEQQQLPSAREIDDRDQNCFRKSWLTREQQLEMLQAVRALFYITTGKDFSPEAHRDELTRLSAAEAVGLFLDTSHYK